MDWNSEHLEDFSFTINKEYASRFEHNKKREELHRLQEKYGKDEVQDEESSGSDEDEDAIYDSISKDKSFLRVLSKLKSKDPDIYDKTKTWFGEESTVVKEKKEKPVFLKDYERKTLLEKGSTLIDSDDEVPITSGPTYNQEQASLKAGFKAAAEEEDGEEELLTLRSKSIEEKEKEDEDYRQWLKGERAKMKDPTLKSDYDALRKTWTDPNLDDNEKFLRDFILNKGWVEDDNKDVIPTYDEIIDEDEDEEDKHENFERQFNFRFEEPGHDLIKNYPRTIANSVRKSDDSRKEKRKKKKERKEKEREERQREIERLKKLKLEEIEGKLSKLSESAGKDVKGALTSTLEEDFSPEDHDRVMSELFNEEYYKEEDDKKPVFSDSDEDLINDEAWFEKISSVNQKEEKKKEKEEEEEDEPTVIYRPEEEEEEEAEKSRKKSWKRKRSRKFKEAVVKPKPVFNPDQGPFEKYFDEYYQLDCEDVIGETRCRFGYRKATPCTYGLTVDEILMADEKELNQWYSFKKMMKYRSVDQESKDLRKFQNKRHNEFMKRQILPSLYPEVDESTSSATASTSNPTEEPRKKKKKKTSETIKESSTVEKEDSTKTIVDKKKKKKTSSIAQSRLDAYGLS